MFISLVRSSPSPMAQPTAFRWPIPIEIRNINSRVCFRWRALSHWLNPWPSESLFPSKSSTKLSSTATRRHYATSLPVCVLVGEPSAITPIPRKTRTFTMMYILQCVPTSEVLSLCQSHTHMRHLSTLPAFNSTSWPCTAQRQSIILPLFCSRIMVQRHSGFRHYPQLNSTLKKTSDNGHQVSEWLRCSWAISLHQLREFVLEMSLPSE